MRCSINEVQTTVVSSSTNQRTATNSTKQIQTTEPTPITGQNPTAVTSEQAWTSDTCIIDLEDIVPYFSHPVTYFILKSSIPSQTLVSNPANLTRADTMSIDANQLSILMKNFNITALLYTKLATNSDVYSNIQYLDKFGKKPEMMQGLWLTLIPHIRFEPLLPFLGLEGTTTEVDPNERNTSSLIHYPDLETLNFNQDFKLKFPCILRTYLWPELCYLKLTLKYFNLNHVMDLRLIAPKLNCLKLYIHNNISSDATWSFDWDSLPWKTGFVLLQNVTCIQRLTINLRSRIKSHYIPTIHFCYGNKDRQLLSLNMDLICNQLGSLGYLQITISYIDIYLNFSHNNLSLLDTDFKEKFHILNSEVKNLSPKVST